MLSCDSGRLVRGDHVGFCLTFGELDFLVMFIELLHQTIQLFLSICSKRNESSTRVPTNAYSFQQCSTSD